MMMLNENEKALAALIAETVQASLSKEIREAITDAHLDITEQIMLLTSKVEEIQEKVKESEKVIAYLSKDIYLMKREEGKV